MITLHDFEFSQLISYAKKAKLSLHLDKEKNDLIDEDDMQKMYKGLDSDIHLYVAALEEKVTYENWQNLNGAVLCFNTLYSR